MLKFVIEVDLPNASSFTVNMLTQFIHSDVQVELDPLGGSVLDSYVIRVDEDGVEIGEED